MDEKRTSTERPAAPDIAATSGAASIRTASCPFGRFGVRSFILPSPAFPPRQRGATQQRSALPSPM